MRSDDRGFARAAEMTLGQLLRWSLRLDWEFLTRVPALGMWERMRVVMLKYAAFLRGQTSRTATARSATIFGQPYRYNDRFGIGSVQRVYCSSWRLRDYVADQPVVVDVGANLGQFNRFCEHYLRADRVISIEPVQSSFDVLLENAMQPDDCVNALVTVGEKWVEFHVTQNSQLSSIVKPDDGVSHPAMLHGRPLPDVLREFGVESIDLLKIDTEGSELDVLRSAEPLLDRTDVILVEMSVTRSNTGNIFAIGTFLESRGFALCELIPGASANPRDVDGVFVRSS